MTTTTEKPLPIEVQHTQQLLNQAVREILRKEPDPVRRAAILKSVHESLEGMAATLDAKLGGGSSKVKRGEKAKKAAGDD